MWGSASRSRIAHRYLPLNKNCANESRRHCPALGARCSCSGVVGEPFGRSDCRFREEVFAKTQTPSGCVYVYQDGHAAPLSLRDELPEPLLINRLNPPFPCLIELAAGVPAHDHDVGVGAHAG